MLKHLISLLLCASMTPVALASPDLAETWGAKAGDLYSSTLVMLDADNGNDLTDDYIVGVERFAVTATRLGTWNDDSHGPADFGCIFRGMAEEAELQLGALETAHSPTDREAALKRLIGMFDDAQAISAAAAHAARYGVALPVTDSAPKMCAANPAFKDRLLSE